MSYYATEYTIHFDDTMAYGSHHFMTGFRFQCAARETYLFGERIFDIPGVPEVLDRVHLFTADAYSRNLSSAHLGDRVAVLLTIEDWGRVGSRFCYRVINAQGIPICAGFQNMICADRDTGKPIPVPSPLWEAMESMREIEEPESEVSFRDRVLAGGQETSSLFGEAERQTAIRYLSERHPVPRVIDRVEPSIATSSESETQSDPERLERQAWVFAGQGAFDAQLLVDRVKAFGTLSPNGQTELSECMDVAAEVLKCDSHSLLSDSTTQIKEAITASPLLLQVGIHLQNMLGAMLQCAKGAVPDVVLGHSFGEIAAMSVAGWFDLPTGVRIVCERAKAIDEHGPHDGELLAVFESRHTVALETQLLGLDRIVVAGRNHDQQTIVSGPHAQLVELRKGLEAMGKRCLSVPSQTSFHHPALRAAGSVWRSAIERLSYHTPTIPIFSPIGRRFISPQEDIVARLTSQLVKPFDLQGGIADLVACGVTTFIDCGSSGSLASLLARSTPELVEVKVFGVGQPSRPATKKTVEGMPAKRQPPVSALKLPPESRPQANGDDRSDHLPRIAIVGQGCILPAGATSPQKLLAAIMEQRSGIVSQADLDPNWIEDFFSHELVPDRSTSTLSGHVSDADIRVPDGVDETVFASFSRLQKLLCIALAPCIDSLRDANRALCLVGATADGFEDQDISNALRYAGIDPNRDQVLQRIPSRLKGDQDPHGAIQEVFDRVVKPGLDVTLVDAACASSLYTVALGMLALESNQADVVLAAGAFCPGPGNNCLFSQFRGTTATGCRPFDASANGVVFSEGAAVVVMRRMADAKQLGLPIAAVIRGVGMSSDGRSSSANVPQSSGQIISLERCYEKYKIDRSSIDAIEAHGTATPVGDATELQTLAKFFDQQSDKPIPIHSIKGLLGHTGWAAGTASLIAACEYLRTGTFPRQAGFSEPSKTLQQLRQTIDVPSNPISLGERESKIAIDGFGFGGANAHLVLQRYADTDPAYGDAMRPSDDELVFVAMHQLHPTKPTAKGMRFDRDSVRPPEKHVMLPDLADDLDITQTLTMTLVHELIEQFPQFDEDIRDATGIVLALRGKTERGIEATSRVLAGRLRRHLMGLDSYVTMIDEARDRSRPSGPYTLQGMMPNVASGRAALHEDLHGLNLVVDAGPRSLNAALNIAELLLRGDSGTRLAIVADVSANSLQTSDRHEDEQATAFAITTRRFADRLGWQIKAKLNSVIGAAPDAIESGKTSLSAATLYNQLRGAHATAPTEGQVSKVRKIEQRSNSSELRTRHVSQNDRYPIFSPVWVETPAVPTSRKPQRFARVAAVVPSDRRRIEETLRVLADRAQEFLVIVAGPSSSEATARLFPSHVVACDLADEEAVQPVLERLEQFRPDAIVGIDFMSEWDPASITQSVLTHQPLVEMLFLIARANVQRLTDRELELWTLLIDGWDNVVHPFSGAVGGLFKAIRREIKGAKLNALYTRGLSAAKAFAMLAHEREFGWDNTEIVYDGTTRLVRRLRQSPTKSPMPLLDSKSVVIASGGARGVTALLLETLIREYGCTCIALGRSSLEPYPANDDDANVEERFYREFSQSHPHVSVLEMKSTYQSSKACWEAHRTIENLAALGNIEYIQADVTDRVQVAQAVRHVRETYGRVDVILHGAGVQYSKRLQDRSLDEFRTTFDVKVAGLNHLVSECRIQTGRQPMVHTLTSAYSVFGNDGQHDYGAANETLDRLCDFQTQRTKGKWSSIAWLAWHGRGMTSGSEYRALAKQRGLSALSAEEGVEIFNRVVSGRVDSAISVPLSASEHVSYAPRTIPLTAFPTPLNSKHRTLETSIDLMEVDCLKYHLVNGIPTLPGAWVLELFVSTAVRLTKARHSVVEFESARFKHFVQLRRDFEPNLRVVAEEHAKGISVWLIGDVALPDGRPASRDVVYSEATLRFHSQSLTRESAFAPGNRETNLGQKVQDPFCRSSREGVALSGPFRCLRHILVTPQGRHATFSPDDRYETTGAISTYLIDAALRLGAMHAAKSDALCVPVSIGRLMTPLCQTNGNQPVSYASLQTTVPELDGRDIVVGLTEATDDTGRILLTIENARATQLS